MATRLREPRTRPRPAELSRQLREDQTPSLRRRRAIVGLGLVSSACMGLIAAYQVGLIRRLPDLPLPYFDAEAVDASDEAYEKLDTPDALLGMVSYSITMALAGAGGRDRSRRRPWLPLLLAAKAAADAAQAGRLTYDQWARHRAFCIWCLVAAGATFAVLPLALADARDALKHLSPRSRT